MRNGFTTGTCAQAAAKGACLMLTTNRIVDEVEVKTPSGVKLSLGLAHQQLGKNFAKCAVIKKSGESPDVTNGAKIFAKVRLSGHKGVSIKASEGVGKVTLPGLAIEVGEWAINPVPREMILREASRFLPKDKGFEITISVPGGNELAKRTYNPKLGIVGGISIIGTTGIVEPKSLDAYRASLALELNVLKAQRHKRAVLVLGYVGEKYAKEALKLKSSSIIKIGDHVGFMLKQCAKIGIKKVLLIGHIGKLIKVTNGQFNTHCRFGDNRVNSIARYAKLCGADKRVIGDVLNRATAEATIGILKKAGLMNAFKMIAQEVSAKAEKFVNPVRNQAYSNGVKEEVSNGVNNEVKIDCVLLSLEGKILGRS